MIQSRTLLLGSEAEVADGEIRINRRRSVKKFRPNRAKFARDPFVVFLRAREIRDTPLVYDPGIHG